jgi:hypothetical protein
LLLLLPACGEKVGMRGPLRWAENISAKLRIAATPLTLASLDLSLRGGER